jgi:hypothetical protein
MFKGLIVSMLVIDAAVAVADPRLQLVGSDVSGGVTVSAGAIPIGVDGTNIRARVISGDGTIDAIGVLSLSGVELTDLESVAPARLIAGNTASQAVAMAVQGDVTVTQNGTNLTTAITAGVILNADVATNAAIASSKLTTDVVTTDSARLLTEGFFDVQNTTQLVFVTAGATNVIDADISTP